ncbi:MAG: amidophosphoribosyltransferase [Actinobacteria bacterium]|nr:amidophosphoribosyltransferase [Actinomycetota bacterium]
MEIKKEDFKRINKGRKHLKIKLNSYNFQLNEIHEECGIFGIYSNKKNVAEIIFYGLQALQHRGQESAGIAVSDGENILIYKDLGLVSSVFNEQNLAPLQGHIGIGHSRYSTKGKNVWRNSQPIFRTFKGQSFAIAHNGNLINTESLRKTQIKKGARFETTTDTEIIASLIETSQKENMEDAIKEAISLIKGSFSLLILTCDKLMAIRDPNGFRPMVLGIKADSYIIASETCALDIIDAKFIREVDPGEFIIIDEDGIRSQMLLPVERRSMCVFELIYFARPDSYIYNRNLYEVRHKMGEELAKEAPADADLVISVPDSGTPAAVGYSAFSKIPYAEGFIKNRYIGRTFIQPSQDIREIGVRLKLNPLKDVVKGKRIVVVDDSIVRGNTSKQIVKMLYNAGAKEIHMRISSPPLIHPCFYGIDMATRAEFIANHRTVEDIKNYLGVDSLAYLSIEGLVRAIGEPKDNFCFACFNGDYPVDISEILKYDKFSIDNEDRLAGKVKRR